MNHDFHIRGFFGQVSATLFSWLNYKNCNVFEFPEKKKSEMIISSLFHFFVLSSFLFVFIFFCLIGKEKRIS